MPSDEELMARYVLGDRAAFAEIFQRYAPLLLQIMQHRLVRREDARDLVQQTFLQLHRARADFRPDARLRPWLLTIAINLKRRHLRRLARRAETSLDVSRLDDLHFVAPQLGAADAAALVHSALAGLSREQREVIKLHWLAGLPFGEVAPLVGASLAAVKVRAHRGYLALRKMFAQEFAQDTETGASSPVTGGGCETPR